MQPCVANGDSGGVEPPVREPQSHAPDAGLLRAWKGPAEDAPHARTAIMFASSPEFAPLATESRRFGSSSDHVLPFGTSLRQGQTDPAGLTPPRTRSWVDSAD